MRKQRIARRAVPLFAALLLASPALGRAVTDVEGAWYGPAVTKVVVKRVGADRASSTDSVEVFAGTWTSQNSNGWFYAGDWSPAGKKLSWLFDMASRNELQDMLDSWAANRGFPGANTTVGTITTKAKGTENRKGRFLRIAAKVKFTGMLKGRIRNGVARMRGKYTPD